MVGHTLHASTGSWSLDPVTLSYQWYAGSQPIAGATSAAYQPTPAEARPPPACGRHRLVRGLHHASRGVDDDRPGPARCRHRGQADGVRQGASSGRPSGRTSRPSPRATPPRTTAGCAATSRSAVPATRRTCSSADDVGHRVHVQVTMRAENWVPVTRRSVRTAQVRTVPVLHVRTSIRHGRVYLRLRVVSPGLDQAPAGTARVWRPRRSGWAASQVVDGRGRPASRTDARAAPTRSPWSTAAARWRRPAGSRYRSPSPDVGQRTSNRIPAAWSRSIRASPIACAVVT